ncbi:MAG TPA: YdeI/OmpD-associated family protein [Lacisediminihabitans sp.]|uniref:YdeI/OmpD-associated family protein n=1 Tax=Lacisediminihabitans sp. TaxID=2787631 RepID=UPI002EDB3757
MRFHAIVEPPEPTRGLEIPSGIVEGLGGGKRPRVVVSINGHSWQTRVALMRGRQLIGLSHANRIGAGAEIGERVTVEIVLDEEPLTVTEPAQLTEALDADPAAREAFDRLTISQRRQHVRGIEQAKGADTRVRRIRKLISELHERS